MIETFEQLYRAVKELYPDDKIGHNPCEGWEITFSTFKVVKYKIEVFANKATYALHKQYNNLEGFTILNEIKTLDKVYNLIKAIKETEE